MKQAHIPILKAFDEFKFNVGKKTLLDFLKGDPNATIEKNGMDELDAYGCMYMLERGEIASVIEQLLKGGYLQTSVVGGGFNVVIRSAKGLKEIFERKFEPNLDEKIDAKVKATFKVREVNDEDRKIFKAFDFFLSKYNDEQKLAIISAKNNVLCVAGAGSGKTTVLTKRIEFLKKFRSVREDKILAVTFTRKARDEMKMRLEGNGLEEVRVETFNSFCEKILKENGHMIYENNVKVATFSDKIALVSSVMKSLSISLDMFAEDYFNKRQIREKSSDELFFVFVNDVFTIIDYYKNLETEIEPFFEREKGATKKRVAKMIYDISCGVEKELKKRGLRDFSDQITDALKLFRENKDLIPDFEYLLVDEFQDVNLVQYELIKVLDTKNVFVVGDPRQAIYGWRGSDIKFILDFEKEFKDTEVISLKMNYRSEKQIVDFSNLCIKAMGLTDLESVKKQVNEDSDNKVFLFEMDNELLEKRFVLEAIKNSKARRNEIFVLARTNRILEGYADFFAQNGVKYSIKSEEEYITGEPREEEVVLATIHSIKGMEASEVYLVSANTLSFPNKVGDNFVFSLIKEDENYNKFAEELRLFYVAISRAKDKVIITYTGNYSKFITDEMLNLLVFKEKNKSLFEFGSSYKTKSLDGSNVTVLKNMIKSWRAQKSNETGLPTYMIISNTAVDDLVRIRPSNKVELLNVNGLGDAKIAKYGDELLKIING